MDVERLMKDLTVEQLHEIQGSLQTEMEGKKEELREMVGRRYRDVLEASSEVRQVRCFADALAKSIAHARTTQSLIETRQPCRDQQVTMQRFIALHRLLPLIGEEEGDAITDAFVLLLVEQIHKHISIEQTSAAMHCVVSGLTGRILRTRESLVSQLETELGELSQVDWVANQLTALALLQGTDADQLLDKYLNARKVFIVNLLKESSSVLNIVSELKRTIIVVEQLFLQGDFNRAIQAVGANTYRPPLVDTLIDDQAFSFSSMISVEIERVNRQLRETRSAVVLLTQRINEKCNVWVEEVCSLARDSISIVCEFYDKAQDVIEFLHALNGILCSGWPRISTYSIVYQKLFGDTLIKKFNAIIARDLNILQEELVGKLSSISTTPQELFEKRSSKFDSLVGVGISSGLKDYICEFYEGVRRLRDCCSSYEAIAMDTNIDILRDSLALNVSTIISRLSTLGSDSPDSSAYLLRARLCLAILHCDASTYCQTMNKDGERILQTNKTLHSAIEDALSSFACGVASECLSDSVLRSYIDAFCQPMYSLQLATEWEKIELPEVGTVEVPISLSPPLHSALLTLSQRLGDMSVAHLLSRNIRKRLSSEIAHQLSNVIKNTVNGANTVQRTWIQLLFDCRVLHYMFPDESFKKYLTEIETHIDPFDLSLLASPLSTNVSLAVCRTQLLFSCLLVDIVTNKDVQVSQSYSEVIDILPHTDHTQRISLIPRLDRMVTEDPSKQNQVTKAPRNKLLSSTGMKNTPSLSSFVDKISSSWFGGN